MTLDKYHTFDDVKNKNLQTWNRCATAFNIVSDENIEMMREYVGKFDKDSRQNIQNMYNRIKSNGYEKTKAEIMREVNSNHEEVVMYA